MPVLGYVKFNLDASSREAVFMTWKKKAHRNFKLPRTLTRKFKQLSYGIG